MSEESRYYLNHNVRSRHKKNKIYQKICEKCGHRWESKGPNASCPQCKKSVNHG